MSLLDKIFPKERQELWCHNCQHYVQFDIDLNLNGNHVLECPNCKHEHCRVVNNGKITGDRWDSRNGNTGSAFTPTNTAFTTTSTYNTCSSSTFFLYQSWNNTSSTQYNV